MRILLFFIVFFAINLSGAAEAGTVKGVVKFTGKAPPSKPFKTGKYKKACGAEIPDDSLVLAGQNVTNAVVTLEGGAKSSPAPASVALDQKKCRFDPRVFIIPKGGNLEIKTSDPMNHNLHTYSFENDPINLMLKPGQNFSHQFDAAEIIKLECDLHEWMTAWIFVSASPFSTLTGKDGSFEIRDVPPGTYSLKTWHEKLGDQTTEVKVADGVTEVVIEFAKIAPKPAE